MTVTAMTAFARAVMTAAVTAEETVTAVPRVEEVMAMAAAATVVTTPAR